MKKNNKKIATQNKTVAVEENLSQNCDKLGWKFMVYISPTGSTALQKQIDEIDEVVIQKFKTRVRYLSNTFKRDWNRPHARKLKGATDIYEIRFEANGVQQRPIGFFGLLSNDFTILIWATHKQDIYDPAEAIETASKRRDFLKKGTASNSPLQIDGEKFPCSEES
ncbi:hypothetical protein [Candidatus Nitrotoga sp. M5]|uniref:hypothetical protein n=1 Tax=Candidatus Nitrotoga sp. M5 TaxID=2890409 RepID=UPI001EF1AAD9|nr:hypothetical protein [Candidatus Nitrotoga sp. M5]